MKKKETPVIPVGILILILYFFFFPASTSRESVYEPVWQKEVTAGYAGAGEGDIRSFRLGDLFGFFTSDGEILHTESVYYDAALSRDSYINFPRLPMTLLLQNSRAEIIQSFSVEGYPVLSPDGRRIFLIKYDLTGVREITADGENIWSREFASVLTAFSCDENFTLLGLLDGRILLIDRTGNLLMEDKPAASSRIPAVYGCAVRSGVIAGIAGLDKQIFFYMKISSASKPDFIIKELTTDLRREIPLYISESGKLVYFITDGSIMSFSEGNKKIHSMNIRGRAAAVQDDFSADMVYILSGLKSGYEWKILKNGEFPYFTEMIQAADMRMYVEKNTVYLVYRDRDTERLYILRINRERI